MQLTRHTMAGAVALLSLLPLAPGGAQDSKDTNRAREERRVEIRRMPGGVTVARTSAPRAVLGVTITASGNARDTLGVLVSMLSEGGPAEKAGLEEGDRIQAINGVNLRLSAADADDDEMAGLAQRRLTRELAKVKPGDDVELRVLHGSQARTVRVKTVNSEEFYQRSGSGSAQWRDAQENRAALGVSLGGSGSRRDTLGVLVTGVDDDGPAAKAGIYEGARIAEINGVNLRVAREDVEDAWASSSRAQRLQRELRKVKAGDDVSLRVWQDGRYRAVQVKAVKASELPRRRMMFIGDGAMPPMPPMPAMAPMAPMPPVPPMPEVRLEGLREFQQRLPELRMRLDGMREQLRMMPRGRMLVSV